jgi:GTP cyclohydrolase I
MNNLNNGDCEQTTVLQVLDAVNLLAPPELADEWDRIGLQVGSLRSPVRKVLAALDATPAVIAEAAILDCQMIISHHPLIFTPLQALQEDCPEQFLVICLVRQNIGLVAAHTNLDAAPGGVADCLVECLGLGGRSCENVGKYGRLARKAPKRRLREWAKEIQIRLGSAGCRFNTDEDRLIESVAVFPGAFPEEIIPEIAAQRPDLVISGEIRHHVHLMLASRGIAAIDAGHDVTERVVLRPLAEKLSKMLPKIQFAVARDMDYNRMAF